MTRDASLYLYDILESIEKIQQYTATLIFVLILKSYGWLYYCFALQKVNIIQSFILK